jgi:DNA (cytosine-5)-methyltransferase 1
MKIGSLFDGIGGFPLAASIYGIEPVWASEIEKFPIEVTTIRFPNMKHLGDITGVNGAEIEPVDIISAGSPCQDLSVAGKRAGLDGARSGLFMDFMRIVREMREATDGRYPRFIIWENVPGAFSSNT